MVCQDKREGKSGRTRQQAGSKCGRDSETKLTNKGHIQSNKNYCGAKATFGLKCNTLMET
jgi:hypothetical protein